MKPTSLRAIATKAASDKAYRFRNLFGLLSVGYLLWCWRFVNLRAASGVDRKDARSYRENLRENIEGLVQAVQGGWYRVVSQITSPPISQTISQRIWAEFSH